MKKLIVFLSLCALLTGACFANEHDVIWLWSKTDPEVNFFRYSHDEENWTVVEDEVREAVFRYSSSDLKKEFFIQQSYDGIYWSPSTSRIYVNPEAEKMMKERKDYKWFVTSVVLTPYQSYINSKAHQGYVPYTSKYSVGLGANVGMFWNKFSGINASVSGSFSFNKDDYLNFMGAANASIGPSFRFVSHELYEVRANIGLGAQFEYDSVMTHLVPCADAGVVAAIHLFDNLNLLVAPSLSVALGSFGQNEDYVCYTVRAFSLGVEYQV